MIGAVPALAQEAASPPQQEVESGGLTEIIVQARKISESLQDVPVAVTALTAADIERQNVQQLEDLANFAPGLQIISGASAPSSSTIALRGQIQNDILATLDPSVGTYVDGVYWARAYGLNASILDVELVQVLKGPQGTLFGRNTTGGALLITTRNPDLDEFGGRLSASYGRFNEYQLTGIFNVPIVTDKVGLRIAGSRIARDGTVTNVAPATATTAFADATFLPRGPYLGSRTGEKYDNRDRWNARAKLALRPTETLELLFSGEYYEADETGASRQLLYVPTAFTSATRPNYNIGNGASVLAGLATGSTPATAAANGKVILDQLVATLQDDDMITSNNERPSTLVKTTTLGFTASLEVPWGEAKLLTGYRNVETATLLDVDGTPYSIFSNSNQQELSQYSAELQTTGKLAESVDLAAGLFYFNESGYDIYSSRITPAVNPSSQNSYGAINNDSMGLYTQLTYRPVEAIGITAGARYSIEDKALESRNSGYNRTTRILTCRLQPLSYASAVEDLAPEPCSRTLKDSSNGWSYTFGLDYRVADDSLLYIKTAKGLRAGGVNYRATALSQFVAFDPEEAFSYEAGLKTELLDRRFRFNLAAYQTDVEDLQRSVVVAGPGGGAVTVVANNGNARIRGFEADVAARPTRNLTLAATVALVDFKYTEFADATGDRSQERLAAVPRWQYSLAADYGFDLSADAEANLHIDYAWRDEIAVSEYNFPGNPMNDEVIARTTLPSLGLLGARASVNWGAYEFAVFGRNLTNERKFDNALTVLPVGFVNATRQEPATYGVSAAYNF